MTIGDALPGMLAIQNGGAVNVVGPLQVGLQAHNTPLGDGVISEGTDGAGQQASSMLGSLHLGNVEGSTAQRVLDVLGTNNHDRLIATGPAKVGGQLVLSLRDGIHRHEAMRRRGGGRRLGW